ncbi:MAG TPA: DUF6113 family protein [Trebonia sp.]|nr:DUF6113 family protein [Trebonia sp.]
MGTSQDHQSGQRAITAVGYLVLFLLGAFQGMIGSFQYNRSPAPLIAIVFVVIILVTCVACGWGVGTFAAGLLPAVGWIIAAFVIAMPRPNGSVIVTQTAAGEWFLYGGALACVLGSVGAFVARVRRSAVRSSAPPR